MSRKRAIFILVCLVAAWTGGCVEREMTITSVPAGAVVEVSGEEIGLTPVRHRFTWYGDYRIVLRKDGYETVKTHAQVNPPLYEYPPLDLLSAMAPWTYHDKRYLHYTLEKPEPVSDEQLIRRAVELGKVNAESPR